MSKYQNIALIVNDLPFNSDVLLKENINVILYCDGNEVDPKWLTIPENKLINILEMFSENDKIFKISAYETYLVARRVLDDYDLYHVLDRYSHYHEQNLSERDIELFELILIAINFFKTRNIDALIIHDTPHERNNFILASCAKALGIQVLVIRMSALPWRAVAEIGFGVNSEMLFVDSCEHQKEHDSIHLFLDKTRRNYEEAIPKYEDRRLRKFDGDFWSWKREIYKYFILGFSKKHLFNSIKKYKSLKKYEKKQESFLDLEKPYVAFFLHIQPERTTCPEGGIFNQQYLALRFLRDFLPKDFIIYIKEHPSTYRHRFVEKFRFENYYDYLTSIDGVKLLPLSTDTFNIIDHSQLVATITGTVGLEAAIRGKPSVYFGNPFYKGLPLSFSYQSLIERGWSFEDIIEESSKVSEGDFLDYFKFIIKNSTGDSLDKDDFYNYENYRKNAIQHIWRII